MIRCRWWPNLPFLKTESLKEPRPSQPLSLILNELVSERVVHASLLLLRIDTYC